MLRTDRLALDAEIQHARLAIQERDLNNVTTFLDGLATQAALLAGFAFISFTTYDATVEPWKIVCLYLTTSISLGANLFVVCVGQLVTIFGPTLALKGPKGSMERAVNLMRYYRTLIFWMFILGLVGFAFMIICLLLIYLQKDLGVLVSCLCLVFCFFVSTFVFSAKVLQDFKFKSPDLKYVVKRDIDVPGNLTPQTSINENAVSAVKFLGIDGKVNDDAGKF